MSDYQFNTDVARGKLAEELGNNSEQFAFVVTNAFSSIDIAEAIELGELGDEADQTAVVEKMRDFIAAIEAGALT